jgi:O-antigen/teichoic acid export membrane protein
LSIFKNTINVSFSRLAPIGFSVITLPIVLIKLSVEEIGILGLILITSQFMSLTMLAVNKAIPRFLVGSGKVNSDVYNFNGLWLFCLFINLLIYFFLNQIIWDFITNGYSNKLSIFIILFFLKQEIDNYLNEWLIAQDKTLFLRNYKLLETGLTFLLTIFLLLFLNLGFYGRIFSLLIPGLFIGIIVMFHLNIYKISYKKDIWVKYISYSKSLALSSLGTVTFNYLDRILIMKLIPENYATNSLGIYEIANKVANIIKAIINSLSRVFHVKYNKIASNNILLADRYSNLIKKYIVKNLLILIIIFNTLSFIGLCAISKFDKIYLTLIPLITFGYWLRSNFIFFINQLLMTNRQILVFIGTLIAGLINTILNFILIPKLGIVSAALTTTISYSFLLVYFYYQVEKTHFKKLINFNYLFLAIISNSFYFLIYYLL